MFSLRIRPSPNVLLLCRLHHLKEREGEGVELRANRCNLQKALCSMPQMTKRNHPWYTISPYARSRPSDAHAST